MHGFETPYRCTLELQFRHDNVKSPKLRLEYTDYKIEVLLLSLVKHYNVLRGWHGQYTSSTVVVHINSIPL